MEWVLRQLGPGALAGLDDLGPRVFRISLLEKDGLKAIRVDFIGVRLQAFRKVMLQAWQRDDVGGTTTR